MFTIAILFWILLAAVFYVYFGYPLILWVGARLLPRRVLKGDHEPTVSVLIAAYNEAAHIGRTIENKLALDYPHAKLQIVVVSDGSADGTDDIAHAFEPQGIIVRRQEPRNGKSAALNLALTQASGEIVVFADANSLYERSALRRLVSGFADPSVGYVTGKLIYANPDGTMTGDGCSMYMRYENFIRTCETAIGSVVGVNGGIDAVRRSLYKPMKADDLPDLVLPLRVIEQGYRVIYEPAALLSESANVNSHDEYRMRVRVALRALWTLTEMPGLLSVKRHGFYAIQLLSHKALRYMAFAFMIGTFVTAALLWNTASIYRLAFVAQAVLGLTAWLGYLAERRGAPNRILSVPYYFILVNAASLQAFAKFVRRERYRVWNPRQG